MIGPVSTEALVESLASEIADILLDGGALSPKDFAQRLVAGPALQQVTAERDGYRETHRWNIDRTGAGEVLVCRGYHDKGEDCDHERFVPEERLATATSELARLRADVEAVLDEATRMSSILLMAGEMTAQERRTARAVALGISLKVHTALARAATAREGGKA